MLRLSINNLQKEIEFVIAACSKFVEDLYPLESFKRQLDQINRTRGFIEEQEVAIPISAPLRTKRSYGEYEPDGAGEHNVFGTLSFVWRVAVDGAPGRRELILNGLMSTTVQIANATSGNVLASWNFDIGNNESPGCHFHVQACWPKEANRERWPEDPASINIPRLPVPITLPTDALEFLLGELFQDTWPPHRARFPNPYQAKRLISIFQWQIKKLESGGSAAWHALKAAKPVLSDKLFVE